MRTVFFDIEYLSKKKKNNKETNSTCKLTGFEVAKVQIRKNFKLSNMGDYLCIPSPEPLKSS